MFCEELYGFSIEKQTHHEHRHTSMLVQRYQPVFLA